MSNNSDYQNQTLSAALRKTDRLFIHADRLTSKVRVSQGGFGVVYTANLHLPGGSRVVAIKELKDKGKLAKVEILLQALFREIIPWAGLEHENVVPFIGYSFDGRTASLLSPWYQNGNVEDYIKKFPTLDRRKVVLEIAAGLEYLHTRDPPVIHGDIKASNILMSGDPEPVAMLSDFGLARFATSGPSGLSTSGGFHGTFRWTSPEVLLDSPTTPASDVWSYGCVVGEVLSSKKPLGDITNDIAVVAMLVGQDFSSDALYQEIPQSHPLREVLKHCWARHWDDRLSMTEVRKRLEEVIYSVIGRLGN